MNAPKTLAGILRGFVMFLIAFALLAFFGSEAWGSSLNIRLSAGGYSKHLISDDITNESHDYFAVQVWKVELGRFNNSYGRESYYLAYEALWENVLGEHWDFFLKSGIVYGYVDCLDSGSGIPKKRDPYSGKPSMDGVDRSGAWCPMSVPGLRYTRYEIEPEFVLVGDAATVAASYQFDLMRIR